MVRYRYSVNSQTKLKFKNKMIKNYTISRELFNKWVNIGAYSDKDIYQISKQLDETYSRPHIKNVLVEGYNCDQDVYNAIIEYYNVKCQSLQFQKDLISNL